MSSEKYARSRSADPMQERLRERKQVWNKSCSDFIARLNAFKPHLISFKRGLNGRGDQKAGLPISNIKDALPSEIPAFLSVTSSEFGELASTFQSLVGEANSIIQEQADYSSRRRKPQNKVIQLRPNQQLPIAAEFNAAEDVLFAEGSNAITRYWARMAPRGWFSREDKSVRLQRLSMLQMAHKLFENLVEIEDAVLTRGLDNTNKIFDLYSAISDDSKSLRLSYNKLSDLKKAIAVENEKSAPATPSANIPSTPSQLPVELAPPTNTKAPAVQVSDLPQTPVAKQELINNSVKDHYGLAEVNSETPIDTLKSNVVIMMNGAKEKGFGKEDVRPFLEKYHDRKKEKDELRRGLLEDRLRSMYEEIYDTFNALHKKAHIESDLVSLAKKDSPTARIWKKFINWISAPDADTAARSQAYNHIREAKKSVDHVMDLLEDSELDIDILQENLSKMEANIIQIISPFKILYTMFKQQYSNSKDKSHPSDMYFRKQIRRDVNQPGW